MAFYENEKRIFAGAVCEQICYSVSDRCAEPKKAKPQVRFKTPEERAEHRKGIAKRRFIRKVNANFTPAGFFATLTLDRESECHTFDEAKTIRRNYARRLLYKFPDARVIIVMGRGRSTARIHYHMIIEADGLTEADIIDAWKDGEVARVDHLRAHNKIDGVDMGADFTQVAIYCFEHWSEEQHGHYAYCSRNLKEPEEEAPRECVREYSPDRPPVEPKGYRYVSCTWNKYGYMVFKYVKDESQKSRGRAAKT